MEKPFWCKHKIKFLRWRVVSLKTIGRKINCKETCISESTAYFPVIILDFILRFIRKRDRPMSEEAFLECGTFVPTCLKKLWKQKADLLKQQELRSIIFCRNHVPYLFIWFSYGIWSIWRCRMIKVIGRSNKLLLLDQIWEMSAF